MNRWLIATVRKGPALVVSRVSVRLGASVGLIGILIGARSGTYFGVHGAFNARMPRIVGATAIVL